MRITKNKAADIANDLLKHKKDELKKGFDELESMVQRKWRNSLHVEIVECYLKHQSYFHVSTYYTEIPHGIVSCKHIRLSPSPVNCGYKKSSDFDQEVIQLNNNLSDLATKIFKSQTELTEYIYKLGTPEKIKKQFPQVDVSVMPKQVTIITPDLLSWIKS